jgi:hypothetical protein
LGRVAVAGADDSVFGRVEDNSGVVGRIRVVQVPRMATRR